MENHPPLPPPEEGDPMGTEEDSVLRFWESPPRNIHELLIPPLGVGNEGLEPSESNPPPDQNIGPVAYNGGNSGPNRDRGSHRPPPQPVAPGAACEGDGDDPNPATPPQHPGWVLFSGPDCTTTCGVLREIIHANDACMAKLSIHGHLGFLSHAVLVLHRLQNQMTEERYIMDLSSLDWISIKQFLENYGRGRYQEGQRLIHDTHQALYDALSVTMDPTEAFLSSDIGEPPRWRSAAPSRKHFEPGESSSSKTNRKSDKGKRGRGPNYEGGPPPGSGPS